MTGAIRHMVEGAEDPVVEALQKLEHAEKILAELGRFKQRDELFAPRRRAAYEVAHLIVELHEGLGAEFPRVREQMQPLSSGLESFMLALDDDWALRISPDGLRRSASNRLCGDDCFTIPAVQKDRYGHSDLGLVANLAHKEAWLIGRNDAHYPGLHVSHLGEDMELDMEKAALLKEAMWKLFVAKWQAGELLCDAMCCNVAFYWPEEQEKPIAMLMDPYACLPREEAGFKEIELAIRSMQYSMLMPVPVVSALGTCIKQAEEGYMHHDGLNQLKALMECQPEMDTQAWQDVHGMLASQVPPYAEYFDGYMPMQAGQQTGRAY
ncbi:hypothetical protein GC177_07870 [bacterium]|nr:hypothetical protein [bacterium]